MELVFVGSVLCTFTGGTTRLVCQRQNRRKQYCKPRWRCLAAPEEGTKDAVQQEEGEISGLAEWGALDAGLENALSKNWDSLQLFDVKKDVKETRAKRGIFEQAEGEDMMRTGGDGEQIEVEQGSGTMGAEEVTDKGAVENNMSIDAVLSKQEEVLESDAAVAAVEEAKRDIRRKKKDATATKKKARSTSSKKKRESKNKEEGEEQKSGVQERKLTQQEIRNSEKWDTDPRWFFVQVKPGCEKSCAISIRNMAKSLQGLKVQEVLVPETTILRLTKGGRSVKKDERIFPGYILVLMVMNYKNYCDVRRVPNVQYFMGDPNRDKGPDEPFRQPIPVRDTEMKIVFDKMETAESANPEMKTQIRPGDTVEVLSGSLQGNVGKVREVKPDSNIVKVQLLMFGRETPLEMHFSEVKVVKDVMTVKEEEEKGTGQEGRKESKNDQKMDEMMEPGFMSSEGDTLKQEEKKAGKASAADDLAALLADIPSSNEYKEIDVGNEGFGFEEKKKSRKAGKKPKKSREKVEDDFAFLGQFENGYEKNDTAAPGDGLAEADEDLASFLSGEEDLNLFDNLGVENWEGKQERRQEKITDNWSGKAEAQKKGEGVENDDDLFAFLDSFEEAEIVAEAGEGAKDGRLDR